jgi:hypothetical protein
MNRLTRFDRLTLASVIGAVSISYYFFGLLIPYTQQTKVDRGLGGYAFCVSGDFYQIWAVSKHLHRSPYTESVKKDLEDFMFARPLGRPGDPPSIPYSYPFYTNILALPVTLFSFQLLARAVPVVMMIILAFSVRLLSSEIGVPGLLRGPLIVLTLTAFPILEGIYQGQPAIIVGVLATTVLYAAMREKYFVSGCLLAASLIKPQMTWMLAAWMLLWAISNRKWRLLAGFLILYSAILGISLVLVHDWIWDWIRCVRTYARHTPPPLTQYVLGREIGLAVTVVLIAFASGMCWRGRKSSVIFLGSLMLLMAVLITPSGAADHDQVVIVPAILWRVRTKSVRTDWPLGSP